MNSSKVASALIGGCTFGALSALPYVTYVNIACCALYVGGGVLAAYLYLKEQPETPSAPYGDGAVVGLLAGVFGGIAATIIQLIVDVLGLGPNPADIMATFDGFGTEPPGWVLEYMGMRGITPLMVVARLVGSCITFAIAACIGSLVGVAIFHKKETA